MMSCLDRGRRSRMTSGAPSPGSHHRDQHGNQLWSIYFTTQYPGIKSPAAFNWRAVWGSRHTKRLDSLLRAWIRKDERRKLWEWLLNLGYFPSQLWTDAFLVTALTSPKGFQRVVWNPAARWDWSVFVRRASAKKVKQKQELYLRPVTTHIYNNMMLMLWSMVWLWVRQMKRQARFKGLNLWE